MSANNDNIWDENPQHSQWEKEVAKPGFARGNFRNYRRGQYGRYRGRPFVKYVSRQQILYDQTCQNTECQIPGQFVRHQDDCPKQNEKDKKDFQ